MRLQLRLMVMLIMLCTACSAPVETTYNITGLPETPNGCQFSSGQSVALGAGGRHPDSIAKWSASSGVISPTMGMMTNYTAPVVETNTPIKIGVSYTVDGRADTSSWNCTVVPAPAAGEVSHTPTTPGDLPPVSASTIPDAPGAASVPPIATAEVLPSASVEASPSPAAVEPTPFPPVQIPALGVGEIGIAVQVPLTGPAAARGQQIFNSITLGIEDGQNELQNFGIKLTPIKLDDQGDAALSRHNAGAIVENSGIVCVLGHNRSKSAGAALPEYNRVGLALISSAATTPDLSLGANNSNRVFWRLVGRDDIQTQIGIDYIVNTLKLRRIFIVHDASFYGLFIQKAFGDAAAAAEIEIVGDVAYAVEQEVAISDQIVAAAPEVVFFAGYYEQAGPIIKHIRAKNNAIRFFGTDGLDSPELRRIAGDAVNGMHYTSIAATQAQSPGAQEVAARYLRRFDQHAPPFFAESYDTARLCIKAIAEAARNVQGIPSRADVLKALQAITRNTTPEPEFRGISGNYNFTQYGDPRKALYFVRQAGAPEWVDNREVDKRQVELPER